MSLIAPDTTMSEETILSAYHANYAALRVVRDLALQPPVVVKDPAELASVQSILTGLLELLDRYGVPTERSEQIAAVNLMYEMFLVTLSRLKESLDLPRVPRSRARIPVVLPFPTPQ